MGLGPDKYPLKKSEYGVDHHSSSHNHGSVGKLGPLQVPMSFLLGSWIPLPWEKFPQIMVLSGNGFPLPGFHFRSCRVMDSHKQWFNGLWEKFGIRGPHPKEIGIDELTSAGSNSRSSMGCHGSSTPTRREASYLFVLKAEKNHPNKKYSRFPTYNLGINYHITESIHMFILYTTYIQL